MDNDCSWRALVNPGAANSYFRAKIDIPFTPCANEYSLATAWWLSEVSRCLYVYSAPDRYADPMPNTRKVDFHCQKEKQNQSAAGQDAENRQQEEPGDLRICHLEQAGLQVLRIFKNGNAECIICTRKSDKRSNCPGYADISQQSEDETVCEITEEDQNFTILAFRGTKGLEGWISNLDLFQVEWENGGLVHRGFQKDFMEIWGDVENALKSTEPPYLFTGHSLGGALATLAASLFPPDALYTFGSPKVGDMRFVQNLSGFPIYRVVNGKDLVPTLPPSRIPFDFSHAGEGIYMNDLPGGKSIPEKENKPDKNLPSVFFMASSENTNEAGYVLIRQEREAPPATRWLREPPKFLYDHAPVNYSANLEKEIIVRKG